MTQHTQLSLGFDGRLERGRKTRTRVLIAAYELVKAGNWRPTVGEIARKIGCAERTIYMHFRSGEKLRAELIRLHGLEFSSLLPFEATDLLRVVMDVPDPHEEQT